MKEIATHLSFDGNCREAMEFYKRCLGGDLVIKPYPDTPEEFSRGNDRIMHSILKNASAILMASDTMPGRSFQPGNNFSICVSPESTEETDKLFVALGDGGQVGVPLQDTFWGARFGELTDKFGIHWMLNFEKARHE